MSRNERLGAPIFRDPAWDMLLDLLVAHNDGKRLSVSALCLGSGVAMTTALRHIDRLERFGFVTREDDCHDERRIFVDLVDEKRCELIEFLSEWQWFNAKASQSVTNVRTRPTTLSPSVHSTGTLHPEPPQSVFLS
jgi:DNA-binding transcriptional ArsR family regulator